MTYRVLFVVQIFIFFALFLTLVSTETDEENEPVEIIEKKYSTIWPMGLIPYYVDQSSYDDLFLNRLMQAMKTIESDSCVRFHALNSPAEGNGTWLFISNPENERECVHQTVVGGGRFSLVLGLDCLKPHEILHSLLHGVGIKDEITHPNRGSFVRIMWDNIKPEYRNLFLVNPMYSPVEYDSLSTMHFHVRAFSRNGQATIEPLIPGLDIRPSSGLSHLDKLKLRVLFGQECSRRHTVNLVDTCGRVLKDGDMI